MIGRGVPKTRKRNAKRTATKTQNAVRIKMTELSTGTWAGGSKTRSELPDLPFFRNGSLFFLRPAPTQFPMGDNSQ
ncbi:hypothetical protein OUZ56_027706 [Daphnia magna]|uniref:Uncharacterized protein n=1 Tax=Daphnia magna TaxID=35525 RepID=A0ABR0B1P0_9CRUS|nr:hypothetical protein OUZ56_027706 [Daphnia magna]